MRLLKKSVTRQTRKHRNKQQCHNDISGQARQTIELEFHKRKYTDICHTIRKIIVRLYPHRLKTESAL